MSNLFSTRLVLTFAANDIDHADEIVDDLYEWLTEKGFEFESAVIEESVKIDE